MKRNVSLSTSLSVATVLSVAEKTQPATAPAPRRSRQVR